MKKISFLFVLLCFSYFLMAQGHSCKEDLFPQQEKNRLFGYVNIFGEWKVNPIFSNVFPFHGKTAIVQQGSEFGVISCEGKVIIQPKYDEIKSFKGGVAWVRDEDKWGLVSDQGEELLAPKFFEIKEISRFSRTTWIKEGLIWGLYSIVERKFLYVPQFDGMQVINLKVSLVKKDGKSGFINHETGKYLIEPSFRTVLKIAPYIMAVEQDHKWGIVNDNGQRILPIVYDTIYKIHPNRLMLKSNEKYALASFHGRKITKGFYDDIQVFKDGAFRVKRKNKYGFINARGKIVIPLEYDTATYYHQNACIVRKKEKYFVISTKNKMISAKTYENIKRGNHQNYFIAKTKKGWTFLDQYAQQTDSSYFQEIVYTDSPSRVRVKLNNYWGYYNSISQKMIIATKYTKLGAFEKGFFLAEKDNKWGVLDPNANTIIPHLYQTILMDSIDHQLVFEVQKNNLYGLLSIKNREVLPINYQKLIILNQSRLIASLKNKTFLINNKGDMLSSKLTSIDKISEDTLINIFPLIASKKGKKALLNSSGELIFKPIYQEIKFLDKNLYKVKYADKWGIIDVKGNVKVDFLYQELVSYNEFYIIAQKNNKWGYINERGIERINFVYDEVKPFQGEIACVMKNGKWGIIDKRGKVLIPYKYDTMNEKDNKRYLYKGDYKVFIKPNGVIQR